MARILFLVASLLATPLFAAELGESYVKLFQVQLQIANRGNAGAQYSLGEMYEQGLGTNEDLQKAYEWYEKAAAKGDVRAKHKLASRKSAADEERAQKALAESAAEEKNRSAHEEKVKQAMLAKKKARIKALLEKQANRKSSYELE